MSHSFIIGYRQFPVISINLFFLVMHATFFPKSFITSCNFLLFFGVCSTIPPPFSPPLFLFSRSFYLFQESNPLIWFFFLFIYCCYCFCRRCVVAAFCYVRVGILCSAFHSFSYSSSYYFILFLSSIYYVYSLHLITCVPSLLPVSVFVYADFLSILFFFTLILIN